MPQVTVGYNPDHIASHAFPKDSIAEVVAKALSCSECTLVKEDVEIKIKQFGPLDEMRGFSATVIVRANDYPSRRENLRERNNQIKEGIFPILRAARLALEIEGTSRKAFVWTRLAPGEFAEFEF